MALKHSIDNLIRLCRCTGHPQSSLVAYVIRSFVILKGSVFDMLCWLPTTLEVYCILAKDVKGVPGISVKV